VCIGLYVRQQVDSRSFCFVNDYESLRTKDFLGTVEVMKISSRSPSLALEGLQFGTLKRGASMAVPKGLPLVPQEEVDKLAADADWVRYHPPEPPPKTRNTPWQPRGPHRLPPRWKCMHVIEHSTSFALASGILNGV
jgi:hypothetical protein